MNNPNRSVWPHKHISRYHKHTQAGSPCSLYQAPITSHNPGNMEKSQHENCWAHKMSQWMTMPGAHAWRPDFCPSSKRTDSMEFPLTSMVYCGMRTHTYTSCVHECTQINGFKRLGLASGSEQMGRNTRLWPDYGQVVYLLWRKRRAT